MPDTADSSFAHAKDAGEQALVRLVRFNEPGRR